ncbi:hypothetical protein GCM10010840_00590 [Deinococcus aerolatus]|uniref:Uncharacterized protein n=1 Tax=Deinococcus aerolatus TaxID=522487 RepID=A0ABQ2FYL5_9DEIO|nr:hypothetical protein GCM10010840_00590 [Deinococcus aerolatus]
MSVQTLALPSTGTQPFMGTIRAEAEDPSRLRARADTRTGRGKGMMPMRLTARSLAIVKGELRQMRT